MGDSRTPVHISIASVVANALLNILLARFLGYRGLALGTSLAALFNAFALLWLLHGRLAGLDGTRVLSSLARIVIASCVMGIAALFFERALTVWIPGDAFLIQAVRLFTTIIAALIVLGLMAHFLRIREFREAVAVTIKRGGSGA